MARAQHGHDETMRGAGNTRARYRRIMRFASWNLAVTWWYEVALARVGLARIAERTRAERMGRFAKRFHVLAVDLGGLMIKVGQYMSSRLDVLPPQITAELEGLQDEVPAVPFDQIRELAERELGLPLERVFTRIDETPVAAGSLGQAHRATLGAQDAADTGLDTVVVKVQRPGIGAIVDVDLQALRKVAAWLDRVNLISSRVDMPALIDEFAQISRAEIDYLHEAQSAERFAEDFADDDRVRVPEVVWERTTRRVLVLEDVTAIKITDTSALVQAGIAPVEVALAFADVMFDQFFHHGFFHADPHPGNIFVTPAKTVAAGQRAWRFSFVDFGMMGEIPADTRASIRRLLIAAATRNGRGLVEAAYDLHVLLPNADTDQLEQVLTELFDRFGGMGFADLRDVDPQEFRDFAEHFGDVVRTLPIQLPRDFLLVGRSLSLTSGVCSALNPRYNVWDTIEPYAADLLKQEGGNVAQDLGKQAWDVAGIVWQLPKRLDGLVTRIEEGRLAITLPELDQRVQHLDRTGRRLASALMFAALVFSGAIVYGDDATLGTALMAGSALPLLHVLFARR